MFSNFPLTVGGSPFGKEHNRRGRKLPIVRTIRTIKVPELSVDSKWKIKVIGNFRQDCHQIDISDRRRCCRVDRRSRIANCGLLRRFFPLISPPPQSCLLALETSPFGRPDFCSRAPWIQQVEEEGGGERGEEEELPPRRHFCILLLPPLPLPDIKNHLPFRASRSKQSWFFCSPCKLLDMWFASFPLFLSSMQSNFRGFKGENFAERLTTRQTIDSAKKDPEKKRGE